MADPNGLTQSLIGFARTLTAGYDISDVLHDLTNRISGVLGIAGAGVSLRRDATVRFVTADHDMVAALERMQEQHQRGPCTDAIRTGQPVLVTDLAAQHARWPEYASTAAVLGIASVASIPMHTSAPMSGR